MTRAEILAGIRRGMAESSTRENVNWSAVTETDTIESFGFDSLALLDLIFDLEQEFGVQIEAKQMPQMKSLGDLVTFLQERMD